MKVNTHFAEMESAYLFSAIAQKAAAYKEANPQAKVISLGIGDVTRPLAPAVVEAMHRAVEEMANAATFHGYPPEQGYPFLLEAICRHDYAERGIQIDPTEVFVSDGAKSDCGNIGDLFGAENRIAVCDPVYPVYVDANIMDGRGGEKTAGGWPNILYMPCTAENGFVPDLPPERADVLYLCFPNNPTGVCATRNVLQKWVDYAREKDALLLFDSAYEAYIEEKDVPHSIYELEGAKECAIEFRSFSKTAGFTGVRCGYTVVPKALKRGGQSLNALWARRQATKFNGVSYITQRAAEAVYTPQGQAQIRQSVAYYKNNARTIYAGLTQAGFTCFGGVNSPYVWLQVPQGMTSWGFFDTLLEKVQVVGTPGCGFGSKGEGYFRLTGFGDAGETEEAVLRIARYFK